MRREPGLIRHYRELARLSMEDLAKQLHVAESTVYNYVSKGAPSSKLLQLVQIFFKYGVIRDYETAKDFWARCGSQSFPEPPELRQMFERVLPPITTSSHPAEDLEQNQLYETSEPVSSDTLLTPIPYTPWYKRPWLLGAVVAVCSMIVGGVVASQSYWSSSAPTVTIVDDMAYIPAGPFPQGSTPDQLAFFEDLCIEAQTDCKKDYFADELPQRKVSLSAFYIDVHEVTNEKFHRFVDETAYLTTAERNGESYVWDNPIQNFVKIPGANWRHPGGSGTSSDGHMHYPVVHVSWEDANAYCTWARKRLPTEAEWEKAARGPDGRLFPWGNAWNSDGGNYVKVAADGTATVNGPHEVGQHTQGASPYGVQDLLGNVSEWVADVYDPDYYVTAPARNPYNWTAPKNRPSMQHSRRGGGWATRPGFLHSAWRIDRPDETHDILGFRCARNP